MLGRPEPYPDLDFQPECRRIQIQPNPVLLPFPATWRPTVAATAATAAAFPSRFHLSSISFSLANLQKHKQSPPLFRSDAHIAASSRSAMPRHQIHLCLHPDCDAHTVASSLSTQIRCKLLSLLLRRFVTALSPIFRSALDTTQNINSKPPRLPPAVHDVALNLLFSRIGRTDSNHCRSRPLFSALTHFSPLFLSANAPPPPRSLWEICGPTPPSTTAVSPRFHCRHLLHPKQSPT